MERIPKEKPLIIPRLWRFEDAIAMTNMELQLESQLALTFLIPYMYIYIINDFSRTQNYFLSPFNLLEKSLSPNSAFKLYNTARVLCYMSCQPTIKSCHESLFFKSQTALKVAMSYG